jgi:PPOX class probable F420-dependent enzyme
MSTSIPSDFDDLSQAQVATLATIGPDGRPQLSAVWFLFDDGVFKFSLHGDRQKTKNLRRNPAATLFVLDLQNPMRYVEVRGDAEIAPDDDYAFADRVGAKYGGVDLRKMDGDRPGRVIVTIRPVKVNARNIGA